MIEHLGPGLTFTILAILVGGCGPLLLVERHQGATFRRARVKTAFQGNVEVEVPREKPSMDLESRPEGVRS